MKKNVVCVYRDENHENEMMKVIATAGQNLQKAVDIFNKITGTTLTPEQFNQFVCNPDKLAEQVIRDNADIPEGLNRDKYADLLQLPEIELQYLRELVKVHLEGDIYKTNYCNPMFFSYDGATVKPTEQARTLIDAKSVYLTQEQNKVYQSLVEFVKLSNELRSKNSRFDEFLMMNRNDIIRFERDKGEYFIQIDEMVKFAKTSLN